MHPFLPAESYPHRGITGTLAQHLGYSEYDKLLIVNADDFGLTHGVNATIEELFETGCISSTTIMVTANDYSGALRLVRDRTAIRCGIHITLTSSLPESPAKPVAASQEVPSLLDSQGSFFIDRDAFFAKAKPDQAELEASAQIDRALSDGIKVTHLDSHEGTLQLRPEFAEIYFNLAARYRLPIRLGSRALLSQVGFEHGWIERARRLQLHFPDNFVYMPIQGFASYDEKQLFMLMLLQNLPAGVTELYFHPASPKYENRISTKSTDASDIWSVREWDYQILTSTQFRSLISELGVKLISFQPLNELMQ